MNLNNAALGFALSFFLLGCVATETGNPLDWSTEMVDVEAIGAPGPGEPVTVQISVPAGTLPPGIRVDAIELDAAGNVYSEQTGADGSFAFTFDSQGSLFRLVPYAEGETYAPTDVVLGERTPATLDCLVVDGGVVRGMTSGEVIVRNECGRPLMRSAAIARGSVNVESDAAETVEAEGTFALGFNALSGSAALFMTFSGEDRSDAYFAVTLIE